MSFRTKGSADVATLSTLLGRLAANVGVPEDTPALSGPSRPPQVTAQARPQPPKS
jgi:hypothetical protein